VKPPRVGGSCSKAKKKKSTTLGRPHGRLRYTGNEKEVFRLLTEMHNSIEKRGQANIVAWRERVEIAENANPFAGSRYFGLPEWGRPSTVIDVYYIEHTDREIVLLCERYIEILTRLIGDFEQKHREP
jgi:hypothetical protein